jgi:hypothetical protein
VTVLLRNNADTVLATALGSADLGMTVTQGGRFPSPGSGEYFYATIMALTGLFEVVKVTARSGNVLTIVRAQEGTAALDFIAGSRVELRVTAQAIRDAISDSAVDVDAYFEADGTGTSVGLNVGSGKVLAVGGTLSATAGAIILPQSASPSVTAEGSIAWDTNDDKLVVGTGSGNKTLVDTNSTQTLTNKTLTSPVVTGGTVNNTAIGGTTPAAGAFTTLAASGAVGFLPTGIICMWYGSVATIPTGWALCNGSNGTPDLRDRFVIGARQDDGTTAKTNVTGALTQTGGTKDASVVSHTHTTTVTDPGHGHPTRVATSPNAASDATGGIMLDVTGTVTNFSSFTGTPSNTAGQQVGGGTTGISVANATTGTSGDNQNLPPYYALCYIMRL